MVTTKECELVFLKGQCNIVKIFFFFYHCESPTLIDQILINLKTIFLSGKEFFRQSAVKECSIVLVG
jgi:hypothetical protein